MIHLRYTHAIVYDLQYSNIIFFFLGLIIFLSIGEFITVIFYLTKNLHVAKYFQEIFKQKKCSLESFRFKVRNLVNYPSK